MWFFIPKRSIVCLCFCSVGTFSDDLIGWCNRNLAVWHCTGVSAASEWIRQLNFSFSLYIIYNILYLSPRFAHRAPWLHSLVAEEGHSIPYEIVFATYIAASMLGNYLHQMYAPQLGADNTLQVPYSSFVSPRVAEALTSSSQIVGGPITRPLPLHFCLSTGGETCQSVANSAWCDLSHLCLFLMRVDNGSLEGASAILCLWVAILHSQQWISPWVARPKSTPASAPSLWLGFTYSMYDRGSCLRPQRRSSSGPCSRPRSWSSEFPLSFRWINEKVGWWLAGWVGWWVSGLVGMERRDWMRSHGGIMSLSLSILPPQLSNSLFTHILSVPLIAIVTLTPADLHRRLLALDRAVAGALHRARAA